MGLPVRQQSKSPDSSPLGQHRGTQVGWTVRKGDVGQSRKSTNSTSEKSGRGPWGHGRRFSCPSSARTGAQGGGCHGGQSMQTGGKKDTWAYATESGSRLEARIASWDQAHQGSPGHLEKTFELDGRGGKEA